MRRKMAPFVFAVFMALAAVAALAAPDEDLVSGEWEVKTAADDGSLAITIFDFYLDGGELKGSVLAYPEYEYPIRNGKISGDKISFSLEQVVGGRTRSYFYVRKVKGDAIEFEIAPLSGHGIPKREKITVRRVKPAAP